MTIVCHGHTFLDFVESRVYASTRTSRGSATAGLDSSIFLGEQDGCVLVNSVGNRIYELGLLTIFSTVLWGAMSFPLPAYSSASAFTWGLTARQELKMIRKC